MPATVDDLPTPCLLLERKRMDRNLARLRDRMAGLGVTLRPHLKTCKSIEVARRMLPSPAGPATVSTLREAEAFAAAGVRDMTYAVGIAPQKLERVAALRAQDVDLSVILDSLEQAEAVAARSRAGGGPIPALIEIDADGHRAGVRPAEREKLRAIGRAIAHGGAELRGVLTHAGASYDARGAAELEAAAEQERAAVVEAAAALRAAGLPCSVLSVGSTPTAHFARNLSGVTEVRAGVYVFFDLVMAGLGVCALDDIAITVLATVIGHQSRGEERLTLTDAGWMALSRDRGTVTQAVDQGFGLVCDLAGRPLGDLIVAETSQEHGVLAPRPGAAAAMSLPLGARVRILPNHACATAAQFDHYHVLDGGKEVTAEWPRFGGW
ncbi:MAG: alanine racemase [Terriglobales bacterium]